jgi:hypothetical protein
MEERRMLDEQVRDSRKWLENKHIKYYYIFYLEQPKTAFPQPSCMTATAKAFADDSAVERSDIFMMRLATFHTFPTL